MPKYAKPIKGPGSRVRRFSHFTPVASTSIENLSKTGVSGASALESASVKDENSSEDELMLGRMPRGSTGSSGPTYVTGGSTIIGGPMPTGLRRHRMMRGESEATDDDDTASIPSAK